MSVEQVALPPSVVVQRWRRYGHDRAYVKLGARDLGYRDLITGDVHPTGPESVDIVLTATAEVFERATVAARASAYVPRHGVADDPAPATQVPARRPAPAAVLCTEPDQDLAGNRPGQAVREIATDLRDAAPVRTLLARIVGAKTAERAHRIGADGEVEVARRLATLGPQWRVLHSVPVGDRGSDIDHVVIGPGGVFTVNAKHHPNANVWVHGDTLKVNGFTQPYIRKSRHEISRAARLLTAAAGLDVEVRGIVALVGAKGVTVKAQPADGAVSVVPAKDLARLLAARPADLGDASIARIHGVARHLATWRPTTVRWQDFD